MLQNQPCLLATLIPTYSKFHTTSICFASMFSKDCVKILGFGGSIENTNPGMLPLKGFEWIYQAFTLRFDCRSPLLFLFVWRDT
jgi:hypothetical protein